MERAQEEMSREQFQAIARTLADPRRFAIFEQIAASETTMCGELHARSEISPATLSHHLHDLQEAGLVGSSREGRGMRLWVQREVWRAYLKRLGEV